MPAASPIVNTTPLNLRRQPITISSSPSPLSPSTFVRPRAAGLKTGSRAQQVPDGAATGFASAASLWKLNHFETSAPAEPAAVAEPIVPKVAKTKRPKKKCAAGTHDVEAGERTEGKLVRPKKKRKTEDTSRPENTEAKDEQPVASVYFSPARKQDGAADLDAEPSIHVERARLDISAYTFDAPGATESLPEQPNAQKPTKKPRKRPTKATDTGSNTATSTKPPRKKKAKSASFILNSDDPDLDILDAQLTVQRSAAPCPVGEQRILDLRDDLDLQPPTVPPITATNGSNDHDKCEFTKLPKGARVHSEVLEKSGYFSEVVDKATCNEGSAPAEATIARSPVPVPSPVLEHLQNPNDAAPKRRLSWTPAKVYIGADHGADVSPTLTAPKRQLSDVLGGFGYVSKADDVAHATKHANENALATKRRKIELAEPSANALAALKQSMLHEPVETKTTKRPQQHKKAQTITALATAAFHTPKQTSPADNAEVSEFFPTSKDKGAAVEKAGNADAPKPVKPKKSRKCRSKATAATNPSAATEKRPVKAGKGKKTTKSKFNEADYLPKLLSPGHATAQLSKQHFLFGTSSQLAIDESSTFIRDMQASLQESETAVQPTSTAMPSDGPTSTQIASPNKWRSRIRVPSAPHGTNLSVGQADRELWCETSRDFKGGLWRSYGGRVKKPQRKKVVESLETASEEKLDHEEDIGEPAAASILNTAAMHNETDIVKDRTPDINTDMPPQQLQEQSEQVVIKDKHEDDSWMLLRSDDSTAVPAHQQPNLEAQDNIASAPRQQSPLTARTMSPLRSPLRPLDRNVQLLAAISQNKATLLDAPRHMKTSTTKDSREIQSSPGRRRGRPPKEKPAGAAESPPKASGRQSKKASRISEGVESTSKAEWLDIDEIYDSDGPVTPSPPRRRAKSSPPAITPLQLSPARISVPEIVAPAAVIPSVKVDDSNWSNKRGAVFAQITKTVRSSAQVTDSQHQSWWQKILLYDPLVLEHLTEWLNGQGLRIETRKAKPKPKKKGRKRKDELDVLEDIVEWEVVKEPLQAWMVQKWCEEKSICCLWEGGMRGGVRTRY